MKPTLTPHVFSHPFVSILIILKFSTYTLIPSMPKTKGEKMVLISVHLPKQMLEELDELVKRGVFPSRSEAIRIAIRDLLLRESERLSKKSVVKEEEEEVVAI